MAEHLSVSQKYVENGSGISFWLETFHNAFTYKITGEQKSDLVLCVWDGNEFGEVNHLEFGGHKKVFGNAVYARISLDNNAKIMNEKLNLYSTKIDYEINRSVGNPALRRIGNDNYILIYMENFNLYKINVNNLIDTCINCFGDACDKNPSQYFWNYEDLRIDTTYERYSVNPKYLKREKPSFKILYEAEGCRVDKYKEEDSSYVVDRYF